MVTQNVFLASALAEVPRLLGQLNRNSLSESYGSFDRAFWHYRTNDISCGRYQEALYTLALLYSRPFEGNSYAGNARVLEWIEAAAEWTSHIQRRDGSFDEWYPNEGSFVCTSFVTVALAKAALLLGDRLQGSALRDSLRRSADFLLRYQDPTVGNQVIGGILALYLANKVLASDSYAARADLLLKQFLSTQSPEGWWDEYGGPDAGYLSLTVDYLMQCYEITSNQTILQAAEKATEFLSYFLHPDFTVGGEYLARNTEYLIPSGVMRLASVSSIGGEWASFMRASLTKQRGIAPRVLDDRYLCYILYNWIEAGLLVDKLPSMAEYTPKHADEFFPESGIRVRSSDAFYFVIGLRKGGSYRLYTKEGFISDTGIEMQTPNGRYFSGNLGSTESIVSEEGICSARGFCSQVREPLLTTPRAIIFKTVQLIAGKLPLWRPLMKTLLRRVLIRNHIDVSAPRFERSVSFSSDKVMITDILRHESLERGAKFHFGSRTSYVFIPSARYADGTVAEMPLSHEEVRESIPGGVKITRSFSIR